MSASVDTAARKLPHWFRTPSPDRRPFRVLAAVTSTLAVTVLAALSAARGGDVISAADGSLWLWALLVAVAGLAGVRVWNGLVFALDMPLLLGLAFLYGPVIAGTVGFVASFDTREIRREITLLNALFNRSQVAISVVAAGSAFRALGGPDASWPWLLLPALAAVACDVVVNSVLVLVGASLKAGIAWRAAAGAMRFGPTATSALSYISFGFLALPLMALYEYQGSWGLLVCIVPLILAREAFAYGHKFGETTRELAATRKALEDISGQIAAERRDERSKIASSLHDDVLQALYNVTLHAQVIREDLRWGRLLALEEDVPRLLKASDEAGLLLRDVIRDLRRSPLGRRGVTETVGLLLRHLEEQTDARINAELDEVDADASQQLLIYQVCREALANSIEHAKPTRLWVSLIDADDFITLVVRDDGCGFRSDDVDTESHFGLELMRERVGLAHGSMHIESGPSGTVLTAKFPKRAPA